MPKALRTFILETLGSSQIYELNFNFDGTLVYPSGYKDDIARLIRHGHIRLTTNYSDVSRDDPRLAGAGAYKADTPRGSSHYLFINPRYIEASGGQYTLKGNISGYEEADLRGTIIHELTHALQDYQRLSDKIGITPETAEGAAYLAGAITRRRWGYTTQGRFINPEHTRSGIAYSLWLADWFLARGRHQRYLIPQEYVDGLKARVRVGSAHRYDFSGI